MKTKKKDTPEFSAKEIVLLHSTIYEQANKYKGMSSAECLDGNKVCAKFYLDRSKELENLMIKLDDTLDNDLINYEEFRKLDGKTFRQRWDNLLNIIFKSN